MSTSLSDADVRHASVTVDGATVTFYDSEDTHGRTNPLVLVHGTGATTATHFGWLYPILATTQRVISVDLGQPELTEGLTIDHLRRQVEAVIDEVVPGQKVTLLGYSLGAVVAATVAAARPEVIENLILVAGWMKTDSNQLLRNNVWRELRASNSDALKDFTVFCAFGNPFVGARTLEELAPALNAVTSSEFSDLQMELNRTIDIRDRMENIRARTLIIGCEYDQMVPKRHSKDLFGAIEDARYTEIASGHAVVFERPAELHKLIDNFAANPGAHDAGTTIPALRP